MQFRSRREICRPDSALWEILIPSKILFKEVKKAVQLVCIEGVVRAFSIVVHGDQIGAHENANVLRDGDRGNSQMVCQLPSIGGAVQQFGRDVEAVLVAQGGEHLSEADVYALGERK